MAAPDRLSGGANAPHLIEYGVATLALAGETESGDLHLVQPAGTGVLVSVVDGLGHGPEAAAAARAAITALARQAPAPVLTLLQACHQALIGTRGVVMSLASFDRADGAMTWVGVGNVEGVLLYTDPGARQAHTTLVTRGGIVGGELPKLHAEVISISPGDTLIFATDGIKAAFADGLPVELAPQELAELILARHSKGTDDALVLVARYTGGLRGAA
ncbi:MAG TPA: SpoIIE family protein phosphatase [Gemmatimonadales bacterium]|jgi:serine/threonine protein phosphatase PrpC|nr:SpoIIE family protein phosphatase [Gemmatimonadales bacterium]